MKKFIFFCLVGMLACRPTADSNAGQGEVLSQQNGDVACYLEIRGQDGQALTHMADFSLCERNLVGKRVRYRKETVNVMAPECQGNPDCTQSVEEAIIVEAHPE